MNAKADREAFEADLAEAVAFHNWCEVNPQWDGSNDEVCCLGPFGLACIALVGLARLFEMAQRESLALWLAESEAASLADERNWMRERAAPVLAPKIGNGLYEPWHFCVNCLGLGGKTKVRNGACCHVCET